MSQIIRPSRLTAYVLFLAIALLALYVPMQASVAVYVRYQVQLSLDEQQLGVPGMIQGIQSSINAAGNPDPNLRPSESLSQLQERLAYWQSLQTNPPAITISYVGAAWEAIWHPRGSSTRGAISYPQTSGSYFPPEVLWNVALNSGSGGWTRTGPVWTRDTIECVKWLAFAMLLLVLLPISCWFAHVSRRKSRIRWSHIVRVAVYSLYIPFTVIVVCAILFDMGFWFRRVAFDCIDGMKWTLRIVPPVMMFIWWSAAMGKYLRLPHARMMTLMLMLMCSLLVVTIAWLIDPRFILRAIM